MLNNPEHIFCHQFEELLTDYLDKTLDKNLQRAAAAHVLSCPLCHGLLNEVKAAQHACRAVNQSETVAPSLNLNARILQMTQPETAMACQEFEDLLTDYLDGFLPAHLFHRWERHAVLCNDCTDLPGAVVRGIGACYTLKADELAVSDALHNRILQATLGTKDAATVKMSAGARFKQQLESIFKPFFSPILTAQFAYVAMMLVITVFVLTNAISADGSLTGVYQKGAQLAARTVEQSADAVENGLNLNNFTDGEKKE